MREEIDQVWRITGVTQSEVVQNWTYAKGWELGQTVRASKQV